jgi:hypothetical protein
MFHLLLILLLSSLVILSSNDKLVVNDLITRIRTGEQVVLSEAKNDGKGSVALNFEPSTFLEVTFKLKKGSETICPEHTTIALVSSSTGLDVQFPITSCTKTDGTKFLIPNSVKLAEELDYEQGNYRLKLLYLGGESLLPLITIRTLPNPPLRNSPLFTYSLLHESDTTLKVLPEIHHMFRIPDRRAPIFLALLFSGLLIASFFIFVIGLIKYVGFKPSDVVNNWKLVFFAFTLFSIELILLWFWIGSNGAPNTESLVYKYIPPMFFVLLVATRGAIQSRSGKKSIEKKQASM